MPATAPATGMDSSLAAYYDDNGYVIVRGLFEAEPIDRLLEAYSQRILPSRSKFYRQNTDRYEPHRMSKFGFVEQSFLDIHAYHRYPAFRQAALRIFFCDRLHAALTQISGSRAHNLMQSMMFDANTTTPPHQDWWYLDSVPNGQLIAAWIALQDIHEQAGRFFVIPGTHRVVLHDEQKTLPHSEWLARVRAYFDEHRAEVSAPELRKGDVLFWNSRTIHGSLPTANPKYSRKSLTAHFLPAQLQFGNLFTVKPWINYERYGEHRYFANQPEYSMKSMVLSRLKVALYNHPDLLKLARRFQRGAIADY